jgi:hypothetical protein
MTQHEIITQKIASGFTAQRRKMREQEAKKLARAAWCAYRDEVRRLTELQPLDQVRGIELRGAHYHLDHVVSIRAAWLANWSVEECASVDNLQILPWLENFRKGDSCYCALDFSSRVTLN